MQLREEGRNDARSQPEVTAVQDFLPTQELQQMALSCPVWPENGDSLSVPDLTIERLDEAWERQPLDPKCDLAGSIAAELHADVLFFRSLAVGHP